MLTPRTVSLNPRHLLTLVLILCTAGLMRFGDPGITEFFHDEAMLSMLAQDMAAGKTLPTEGILSSVGIPNPPTSVYVMGLPYRLAGDPLFATMFVAMLNVIGIGLLWGLAYRYFGSTIALIAGLTYALNPWAILYSRKIWAQDYHTPFVLLALLLGLYGFYENNDRKRLRLLAQILCLPVLLFALQIHFAAWALLPLYFWLVWSGRKQIVWRAMIFSGLLSVLILLPYAVGLLRTLEQDPTRISDAISRSGAGDGLSFSSDALIYVARLATGTGLETWVAPRQPADLLAKVPPPAPIWIAFIGGAALIGLISLWRHFNRSLAGFLTLWAGLPLAIFTPTWTDIYPHYFIGSIPALALLSGIGVGQFMALSQKGLRPAPAPVNKRAAKAMKTVILSAFSVVLLTQGLWWRGLLRYLDTTSTPYGFTTPLHYLLKVRDNLAQYDDVLVISDGMWVLFDQEPARWSVFLRDTANCIRTVPGDGYAVFPDGRFAAVIAPNAPPNPVNNLYLTQNPTIYPVRPGDGQYSIHIFEQAPQWNGPEMTPIPPAHFESGVQLTGYRLDHNRMYLEWRLPAPDSALDYQYTGHFLDEHGERLGQRDTNFWPGRHWCEGDRLITWTDIQLPDHAKTLRVGMYQLGTGRTAGQYFSANVLDEAGNPAGQWVDIPLSRDARD